MTANMHMNQAELDAILGNADPLLAELEAELNMLDAPADDLVAAELEALDLIELDPSDTLDLQVLETLEAPETTQAEAEADDITSQILNTLETTQVEAEADDITSQILNTLETADADAPTGDAPTVESPRNSTPSKTRVPRANTPSGQLRAKLGTSLYDYCVLTTQEATLPPAALQAQADQTLAKIDGLAKKVGEKAVNAILAVAGHAQLSCYTRIAVDMLNEAGTLSLADLKARYLKRPYTPGTSSAQSSQMMMVLPALGIARREGGTLIKNPDSVLLQMLCK